MKLKQIVSDEVAEDEGKLKRTQRYQRRVHKAKVKNGRPPLVKVHPPRPISEVRDRRRRLNELKQARAALTA
jgi:hypothetical protein